jgi:membrane-associated phospholipid phosphatase
MVALSRVATRPGVGWVVGLNAGIALLVLLLARPGLGRAGNLLRQFYPLLLLPALYGALDLLNGLGNVDVYDEVVLGWERALFGGEPAREWWQRYPSAFWSTVLHGAYWHFYPILVFPVAWFLRSRNEVALERAVLALTTTFVVCYLCFIFFPVAGPYYQYPRPSAEFLDNPMARLVYGTLSSGSSYGAAFPSSHVAAAFVALGTTWMGSRRAGWILLGPVVLLLISVVYCQMHYALDALAGLVVAGGVLAAIRIRKV